MACKSDGANSEMPLAATFSTRPVTDADQYWLSRRPKVTRLPSRCSVYSLKMRV